MVCDVASGNAGASDWFLAARGSAGGEKEHSDALVQANCSAVSRLRGDGRHAAVRNWRLTSYRLIHKRLILVMQAP
jgi:hypothetical protein